MKKIFRFFPTIITYIAAIGLGVFLASIITYGCHLETIGGAILSIVLFVLAVIYHKQINADETKEDATEDAGEHASLIFGLTKIIEDLTEENEELKARIENLEAKNAYLEEQIDYMDS